VRRRKAAEGEDLHREKKRHGVTVTFSKGNDSMSVDLKIFEKFTECGKNSDDCILCTVVEEDGSIPRGVGALMFVFRGGKIMGTVGGGITEHNVIKQALDMIKSGTEFYMYREELHAEKHEETSHLHAACGGNVSVFMQNSTSRNQLVVFGAGHVGRAIAECGTFAGFDVTVWDERGEFANPVSVPFGKTICCPLNEFLQRMKLNSECYIVIVTRGHALDTEVIKMLENTPAKYIGVIGSRSKIAYVREKLLSEEVSSSHLDRLYQPVGLPIRAETPNEIAISVMSEIVSVRRGGKTAELRGVVYG
jgi:xanthine dehydrogenase accessory factor